MKTFVPFFTEMRVKFRRTKGDRGANGALESKAYASNKKVIKFSLPLVSFIGFISKVLLQEINRFSVELSS
jgi:hypothetical protein